MTSLGFHLLLNMSSSCGFSYAYMYFPPYFGKPAIEYLPLAKTLTLGRPYALSTLLLALVYQALSKYLSDEPYHRIGGALCCTYVVICIFSKAFGQGTYLLQDFGTLCCI